MNEQTTPSNEQEVTDPQKNSVSIETPEVEVSAPEVESTAVEAPTVEVSAPEAEVADVEVSEAEMPEVEAPEVELSTPEVETPAVELSAEADAVAIDASVDGVEAEVETETVAVDADGDSSEVELSADAEAGSEDEIEDDIEDAVEEEAVPEIEVTAATEKETAGLMKSVSGPPEYVANEKMGRVQRIGNDVRLSDIDHKNIQVLSRFLDRHGRIIPRRKTNVSAKVQRQVVKAIKRARYLALLPYTGNQTRIIRRKR